MNATTYVTTVADFYAAAAETPEVGLCCVGGGSLALPELVVPPEMEAMRPIPSHLRDDTRLRAICLSGALTDAEYLARIVDAGFGAIEIRRGRPYRVLDHGTYGLESPLALDSIDVVAHAIAIPADGPCIFTGRTAAGHRLERAIPLDVCDKTASNLASERLWFYTNYHCNLACRYCLTSSSPTAPKRELDTVTMLGLASDAVRLGFRSFGITGGGPFLRHDMPELVAALAARLPVVVLTNGTLFTERFVAERLAPLAGLPVALQISIDAADARRNDRFRGDGSHARALAGLARLHAHGIGRRIGTTLVDEDRHDLVALGIIARDNGVAEDERVVRPSIARGAAVAAELGESADAPGEPHDPRRRARSRRTPHVDDSAARCRRRGDAPICPEVAESDESGSLSIASVPGRVPAKRSAPGTALGRGAMAA